MFKGFIMKKALQDWMQQKPHGFLSPGDIQERVEPFLRQKKAGV